MASVSADHIYGVATAVSGGGAVTYTSITYSSADVLGKSFRVRFIVSDLTGAVAWDYALLGLKASGAYILGLSYNGAGVGTLRYGSGSLTSDVAAGSAVEVLFSTTGSSAWDVYCNGSVIGVCTIPEYSGLLQLGEVASSGGSATIQFLGLDVYSRSFDASEIESGSYSSTGLDLSFNPFGVLSTGVWQPAGGSLADTVIGSCSAGCSYPVRTFQMLTSAWSGLSDTYRVYVDSYTGDQLMYVESDEATSASRSATLTMRAGASSAVLSMAQGVGVQTFGVPEVTISYSSIPASGGTVTPVVSYTQTWGWNDSTTGGGVITSGGLLAYSGEGVGTTGSVSAVSKGSVVSGQTEVTVVTVSVTLNGQVGSGSATVYQAANVVSAEYDIPVVSVSCSDVPAGGGSVTSGTVTYAQSWRNVYTSGASVQQAVITTGGSVAWSGGASGVASLGTTIKARSEVGSALVATVTMNGKSGSGSATVYQAANVAAYGAITVSLAYPSVTPAAQSVGASQYSYSQAITYTSAATSALTSGLSGVFSIDDVPSYVSINSGTGVLGWGANTELSSRSVTVRVSITHAGITGVGTATATQVSDAIASYANPVISSFTCNDIPASGGTVSSGTWSATQVVTYVSGRTMTVAVTSGGTYGVAVSASSLGTTITGRSLIGTLYLTVSANGKSTTAGCSVYQAANGIVSYGAVYGYTVSSGDIPASGGTIKTLSTSSTWAQDATYTSGSVSTLSSPAFTSSTYSPSAGISGSNLGTTVTDRQKRGTLVLTVVCNGVTTAFPCDIYQAANAATSISYGVPVVSVSCSDVPAGGGSVMSGVATYSQSRVQNYTSGGTSSLSALTTGGSVAWSGGASGVASLGTTIKARSEVGSALVATVTMNGKSGSGSATVYQAANSVSYGSVSVTMSYGDISAAGGTVTPTVGYSQVGTYTSGSTATVTSGGVLSYSGTGVNTSTGSVSASSLGTTIKARASVTTATVSVSLNGVLGSSSATVYQAANSLSYGSVSVVPGSYSSFAASGGTLTPGSTTYSQVGTYTSGSTATVTSGGTVAYSMATATGFTLNSTTTGSVTAADRGTVAGSARSAVVTVSVTLNGKVGSATTNATQVANEVVSYSYGSYTATATLSSTSALSAGADTRTVTWGAIQRSKTPVYTSGASGSVTTEVWSGTAYLTVAVNSGTAYCSLSTSSYTNASSTTTSTLTKTTYGTTVIAAQTYTMSVRQGSATGTVIASVAVTTTANAATSISYGVPVVSVSCSDVPAGGGSVTSGVATYSQSRVQNYTSGGTSSLSALTTGGSVAWSGGASDVPSLGTTIKARSEVGSALVATVTMNGVSGSGSATVYQEENTFYDSRMTLATDTATLSAAGGSAHLTTVIYRQYTSGVESVGGTQLAWSWSGSATGFTQDGFTVTAASMGAVASAARSITITATYYNLTSNSVTITQSANSVSYGSVSVTMSYGDISAAGGSVTPTVGYSQVGTYTSGSTATVTSGGVLLYSGTGVNTSTGSVSGLSYGTYIAARASVTTATVSVSLNGQVGSGSATVYQAANKVTALQVAPNTGSSTHFNYNSSTVAAAGGSISPTFTGSAILTFTSGATSQQIDSGTVFGGTLDFSRTYAATNTSIWTLATGTGVLTATNNTTSSARTSMTVTGGLTATFTNPASVGSTVVSGTLSNTATATQAAGVSTVTVKYLFASGTQANAFTEQSAYFQFGIKFAANVSSISPNIIRTALSTTTSVESATAYDNAATLGTFNMSITTGITFISITPELGIYDNSGRGPGGSPGYSFRVSSMRLYSESSNGDITEDETDTPSQSQGYLYVTDTGRSSEGLYNGYTPIPDSIFNADTYTAFSPTSFNSGEVMTIWLTLDLYTL